ncbi:MAG TPA: hypothetical protein VH518_12620 [Tepidisphaeraceae bacterium]|jgi:hypothetical protein
MKSLGRIFATVLMSASLALAAGNGNGGSTTKPSNGNNGNATGNPNNGNNGNNNGRGNAGGNGNGNNGSGNNGNGNNGSGNNGSGNNGNGGGGGASDPTDPGGGNNGGGNATGNPGNGNNGNGSGRGNAKPRGSRGRQARSLNGTYHLAIAGFYEGSGDATVTDNSVSFRIKVTSADGGQDWFEAMDLPIDGAYFSGRASVAGQIVSVDGRLDAPKASRLVANYKGSSQGQAGRIVGSLPGDNGDNNWR